MVRCPFPAGLVRISRSSRNADERLARERVDRFAAAAGFNREQSKLFVVEAVRVGRERCLRPTNLAPENKTQKKENELLQGDNFIAAGPFSQLAVGPGF